MLINGKAEQLQIRVSAAEKAAIQQAAARSGMSVSAYLLSRVLSVSAAQFQNAVAACASPGAESRYALAELNAFLTALSAAELPAAVGVSPTCTLNPFLANYVAAMVEVVCARHMTPPPAWIRSIPPLTEPSFGSALQNLRLHLLTHSPAPFRRRNIFIDSTLGAQV